MNTWKALILSASMGLTSSQVSASINIGETDSKRIGSAQKLTTNWSTLHSTPLNNTYQETIRVMSVCVNGRSFVATLGMAGVWDSGTGAGAGGGAGIVQVFDTDGAGNLVPARCN